MSIFSSALVLIGDTFQARTGIFLSRGENWSTRRKTSRGRKSTRNVTHIQRQVRESNPGHIGGRQVLSPLRHPCFPCTKFSDYNVLTFSQITHMLQGHTQYILK